MAPVDLEGPPPPAPKGSEAEEAALLLAGQQPQGLPSFSELAAVSAAEAAAIRNSEVDSDAIEALSLRSMIGFHSRKPVVKVEVAPPASLEELLAQEVAEKQTAGALPTSGPERPATSESTRPDSAPPAAARRKPDAFAALAGLGGTRAPAVGSAPAKAAPAARGTRLGAPARTAARVVDLATLERQFLNDPEDPEAKRRLAERYLEVDRLDDAITALIELVDSLAGQEGDLFNLGLALARRGNLEDARACFLQLKSEHAGSPWAGKAAVQLLKLKLGS